MQSAKCKLKTARRAILSLPCDSGEGLETESVNWENQNMILPRYSLRAILLVTAICAVASLIVSQGRQRALSDTRSLATSATAVPSATSEVATSSAVPSDRPAAPAAALGRLSVRPTVGG